MMATPESCRRGLSLQGRLREEYGPRVILRFTTREMLLFSGAMNIAVEKVSLAVIVPSKSNNLRFMGKFEKVTRERIASLVWLTVLIRPSYGRF